MGSNARHYTKISLMRMQRTCAHNPRQSSSSTPLSCELCLSPAVSSGRAHRRSYGTSYAFAAARSSISIACRSTGACHDAPDAQAWVHEDDGATQGQNSLRLDGGRDLPHDTGNIHLFRYTAGSRAVPCSRNVDRMHRLGGQRNLTPPADWPDLACDCCPLRQGQDPAMRFNS